MATIKKAQKGKVVNKTAPKMVAGEMTGKMYKKSEIDEIGRKQAAELDKVSVFGREAMKKKAAVKKAQDGDTLRKGQYKRLGRIAEKNPERAERVAGRMKMRDSRLQRGKDIANPRKVEAVASKVSDKLKEKGTPAMKKGGKVVKKKK